MVPAVMRPDAAMHSDAGEEHVAEFTTILVDLDSGDTDGKLRWVETHIGPATMVVYSGGTTDSGHPKLHVYFALTEPTAATARVGRLRSEEHTSELQSLMRNSYAVFCLKKKNTNKNTT